MKRKRDPRRAQLRQRTKTLRDAINTMDYVTSGTLHSRTKVCGRKNCCCAHDLDARHGPYHEWSRRQDGRLRHSIVTPDQAELFALAISNYRHIQQLLAQWERETAAAILNNRNKE